MIVIERNILQHNFINQHIYNFYQKNKKATIAARKRQIALYNMRLFFWEQVREIKTSG